MGFVEIGLPNAAARCVAVVRGVLVVDFEHGGHGHLHTMSSTARAIFTPLVATSLFEASKLAGEIANTARFGTSFAESGSEKNCPQNLLPHLAVRVGGWRQSNTRIAAWVLEYSST